ncbi:DUF4352 domain-containing protein [Streptomyces sp. NPDC054933]
MSRRLNTAIATAALAVGLAACGPNATVSTTPDKSAAGASSPAKAAAPKKTASVGDSLTLTGQTSGNQLTVTLKQWSTSVQGSNDFESPQPGKTWVAGQFEIKNTGSNAYSDSPSNCVQAADASGQRFPATIATGISNGPLMTSDMKLAPGDKALGWIVFEVPTGTKVATVQFTPNSGMADQTGQWAVK